MGPRDNGKPFQLALDPAFACRHACLESVKSPIGCRGDSLGYPTLVTLVVLRAIRLRRGMDLAAAALCNHLVAVRVRFDR
jgi:hypothetical protein